jgi:transposase-like protein
MGKKEGERHGDQLQGVHFPHDIMRMGVRWYVAYP